MFKDTSRIYEFERTCSISRCKLPFTFLWEQPLLEIGTWTLRLTVVAAFLIAGYLLSLILDGISQLTQRNRSLIVIFFLLLPINGARIGLSSARASLALTVFMLGAYLVSRRSFIGVVFGLLCLSYSMFWDSFQVFGIVAAIPLVLKDLEREKKPSRTSVLISLTILAISFVVRYPLSDLVVNFGFAGADDGYNSIRLAFLIRAVLIFGLLTLPLAIELVKRISRGHLVSHRDLMLEFGLFLIGLATFPYLAVGQFANISDWVTTWLPDTSDWDSRHQLLQGLGFATLGAAFLNTVHSKLFNRYFILMVVGCIVLNSGIYSSYYVDGLKQRDIIEILKAQEARLEGIDLFDVVDEALDLNARGRKIRDYEWEGMLETALNRPVRIASSQSVSQKCQTAVIGKILTLRKISGRLKALITRGRVVEVEVSDLFGCQSS